MIFYLRLVIKFFEFLMSDILVDNEKELLQSEFIFCRVFLKSLMFC